MKDRGEIREGFFADLVLLDPATVTDRATYQDPHQFPTGIPHVLVNGQFIVRDGETVDPHSPKQPGRAVRYGS